MDHAHTRHSKGYNSTGAGGVVCARHGLVRKNGLGDLQKGEKYVLSYDISLSVLTFSYVRYANMDFIVWYSLLGAIISTLVLSYDIVCQWSRNLVKRHSQLPDAMRLPANILSSILYFIPKFHIYGHGEKCQYIFSFNWQKWTARTNGEEPERWWAHINPISMSTKEMSPGGRHNVIDDHTASWNFRKIVNLGAWFLLTIIFISLYYLPGNTLSKLLKTAVIAQAKHKALFEKLNATFNPEVVKKWDDMVAAWNEDTSKPCPYEETENGWSYFTLLCRLF